MKIMTGSGFSYKCCAKTGWRSNFAIEDWQNTQIICPVYYIWAMFWRIDLHHQTCFHSCIVMIDLCSYHITIQYTWNIQLSLVLEPLVRFLGGSGQCLVLEIELGEVVVAALITSLMSLIIWIAFEYNIVTYIIHLYHISTIQLYISYITLHKKV